MPPKENLEKTCEECIHYWACSRQCGEPMAQRSATGCECYEPVKSIAAARLIEHLTAENVKADAEREALLGELRKSGCTYCKYETVCEDNPWLFIRKVCDHCVMPLEVYEKVRDELPYSVGVLCPEKLSYKFLPYILKVVQRVRRIDRKRPLQEMLLMMWRSSRREIVKARKEVNGNDEP